MKIITQKIVKNISFLTLLLSSFFHYSCQSHTNEDSYLYGELKTANGDAIKVQLLVSKEDQQKGLSGVQDSDFEDHQGMLFFNLEDREHNFWMPDTYFDLDLFYLDQELKVIAIDRKIPHYIGRADPERIPRGRIIWCRHILEMKSNSPIAKRIQEGEQIKWNSPLSLREIESKIRQQQ